MVQPELEYVLTYFLEMITPQDGAEKQDCERNAGKRWLNRWSSLFAPHSITYLGDVLFCVTTQVARSQAEAKSDFRKEQIQEQQAH